MSSKRDTLVQLADGPVAGGDRHELRVVGYRVTDDVVETRQASASAPSS